MCDVPDMMDSLPVHYASKRGICYCQLDAYFFVFKLSFYRPHIILAILHYDTRKTGSMTWTRTLRAYD